MKLSSLLFSGEYRSCFSRDLNITKVARDLGEIIPGCLFFCIRGARFDTHHMLPEIAARGAAAAVVEIGSSFTRIPGLPIFEARDSRALHAIALSRFFGSPDRELTMIGITGTNGKTSTAFMLYEILRHAGHPTLLIGTVGYFADGTSFSPKKIGRSAAMTTPEPEILYPLLSDAVKHGITHVVMEVSSHALVQKRVQPISFSLAGFTGLSREHLDYHRTMEEYLKAKAMLFEQSEEAVLMIESIYGERLAHELSLPLTTCATEQGKGEILACNALTDGAKGVSFLLQGAGHCFPLCVPIPGEFTVRNALLAAACALRLGVSEQKVSEALCKLKGIPGRMEEVDTNGEAFRVLIDYAHTEAALRALLRSTRPLVPAGGRLVVLFGCGGNRDAGKRAPMGRVVEELADYAYVTSDNSRDECPRSIIREILQGMPNREKRRVIVDRARAITEAILNARAGDLLLLVGKGHERYELKSGKCFPFDERKIVRTALEKRKAAHTNGEI